MQKVDQKIITRKLRPFMAAFILFVMSTLASPGLAQEPQWEIMLPDVHGKIAVDPTDSDVIYVAVRGTTSGYTGYKGGMLKSTDGGESWELYSEGWAIGTPHDIWFHPDNSDFIMVSGGGSTPVIKSNDGGETWSRAGYGITGSSHGSTGYEIAYHQRDSTWFLAHDAGGMDGGVYRSKDGMHWENTVPQPGMTSLLIDESNDVIYGGTWAGLLKSTDGGESWGPSGLVNGVRRLARVPGSSTLYAAATRGIYKSHDQAESWISVNDLLTEQHIFSGGLAISENDTFMVIAGAASPLNKSGGIFFSFSGGDYWEQYHKGLPNTIDISLLHIFYDNNTQNLYANMGLLMPDEYQYHIYRLKHAYATNASDNPEVETELPEKIELLQNYPNPFNPVTLIEYALPEPAEVTLQIYDVMGKLVETLIDQMVSPGRHQVTWDAANAASGVYIYRIQVGDFIQSRQMLLIK